MVSTFLPESSRERLVAKVEAKFPDLEAADPPAAVAEMAAAMLDLLSGRPAELPLSLLDWRDVEPFARSVYAAACAIPPGDTRSYGEIAADLGDRNLARAVGQALGRNPFPIVVPCHRVLGSDGRQGGFSAPGGADTKLRMLNIEGAGRTRLFDELPLAARPAGSRSDRPSPARSA